MAAPKNISHITVADIENGIVYHVTAGEKTMIDTLNDTLSGHMPGWDSTESTVHDNSASWEESTDIAYLSGIVDLHTASLGSSANWNEARATLLAQSGGWENIESVVVANSSQWDESPDISYLSGIVDLHTASLGSSAAWNDTRSTLISNSGIWNNVDAVVVAGSAKWDSNFATTSANSGTWNQIHSTLLANSGIWNNVDSVVVAGSAKWDSDFSTMSANSGTWNQVHSTVLSNSGMWEDVESVVVANSADWSTVPVYEYIPLSGSSNISGSLVPVAPSAYDLGSSGMPWRDLYVSSGSIHLGPIKLTTNGTDLLVDGNIIAGGITGFTDVDLDRLASTSGFWNSVVSTVSANSAGWETTESAVVSNSANWNDTRSTLIANSGIWNNIDSVVVAGSAKWDASFSTTSANSATWNQVHSTVLSHSGMWENVESTVVAGSAKWDSNFATTSSTSGTWSQVHTTVLAHSGMWENIESTLVSNSAGWETTEAVVVANSATWGSSGSFYQEFVSGDLTGGVLTVTHNLGEQHALAVVVEDDANEEVMGDVTFVDTNSLTIDLNSFVPFAGTWYTRVLMKGTNGTGGGSGGTSLPIGTIIRSTQTPGAKWLRCDGSAYLQASYPLLYAQLGILHDFASWTELDINTISFYQLAESATTIVGGGYSRVCKSSDNGATWSVVDPAGYAENRAVVYIPTLSRFVMGCTLGRIYTSDDNGATWTRRDEAANPMASNQVNYGIWTGTSVILVGAGGNIATSPDGINWTARTSGTTTAFNGIAMSPTNTVVAITSNSAVIKYSIDDGANWVASTVAATAGTPNAVIWSTNLKMFVSIGTSCLSISKDGINWDARITTQSITVYTIIELEYGFLLGSTNGWTTIVRGDQWEQLVKTPLFPNSTGQHVYGLYKTSSGNILGGFGGYVDDGAIAVTSYNSNTSFRVLSPNIDGNIFYDSWILGD